MSRREAKRTKSSEGVIKVVVKKKSKRASSPDRKTSSKQQKNPRKRSTSKNRKARSRSRQKYASSSDDDESVQRAHRPRQRTRSRSRSRNSRDSRKYKTTESRVESRRSVNRESKPPAARPPVALLQSPQRDFLSRHKYGRKGRPTVSRPNSTDAYNADHGGGTSSDGTEWLHSEEDDPEPQLMKTSTELAMARMVAGQRESTVIASVAARTAAELKNQLAKARGENNALKQKLSDGLERERALTLSRSKIKLEVRELRYRNTYLVKEAEDLKILEAKGQSKTKARLDGMTNALSELEEYVGGRARAVQREVRHLKALLTSLQRHMSRGYVSSTSQTGQRLITSLWQTTEAIMGVAGPDALPKTGMNQARVHTFRKEDGQHEGNIADVKVAETGPKDDLASTMDGIISDLENDNKKLRAELEVSRNELLVEKQSSKDAAVIPQYRSAVRRARAHAEGLRQRLATEMRMRENLQRRLADAERQLRNVRLTSASNAERSVMADATAAQSHRMTLKAMEELSAERAEYQQAYEDLTQTSEAQQRLIKELQRIIDQQREAQEWGGANANATLRHPRRTVSSAASKVEDDLIFEDTSDHYEDINATDSAGNYLSRVPGSVSEDIENMSLNDSFDNQVLAEDAKTTVAALNNDLENLDSEIAVLQQSLKRIVNSGAQGAQQRDSRANGIPCAPAAPTAPFAPPESIGQMRQELDNSSGGTEVPFPGAEIRDEVEL